MMKLLGTIALVLVIIAATVVITKHGGDILSAFTSWTDSASQVPGVVRFQGVLSDSGGALAADGDYNVSFAFYSAATGGTPLWSETQVVATTDGLFSANVGGINPITPSTVATDELWLGLTVGSDAEMAPRQRVGSAIYALVAGELANPRHASIVLSHDGILKQDITCATPRDTLVVWGSGFQAGESVTVTALGGEADGSDVDILTSTADSYGSFMAQGSSASPAIPCTSSGTLTVKA